MSRMNRGLGYGVLVLSLWACQGDAMSGAQPASAQAQGVTAKSGNPAQSLVNAYITLQTKLAKDDAAGAKVAFSAVSGALKAKGLDIDPAVAKRLDGAAAKGASAATIDDARTAFDALTEAMLSYLGKSKNPLSSSLTVAHCPMALDNKGAKWLQLGDKLENPYFGAQMLRCGTVEKTVEPGKGL